MTAKPDPRLLWFCGGVSARFDLSTPWVADGFWYATDGAILVRKPTRLADLGRVRRPWAAVIFDQFGPIDWRDAIPFPVRARGTTKVDCPVCKDGTTKQCHVCRGTGRVWDRINIQGLWIVGRYWTLIRRLGDKVVCTRAFEPTDEASRDMLAFKCGTITGIVNKLALRETLK